MGTTVCRTRARAAPGPRSTLAPCATTSAPSSAGPRLPPHGRREGRRLRPRRRPGGPRLPRSRRRLPGRRHRRRGRGTAARRRRRSRSWSSPTSCRTGSRWPPKHRLAVTAHSIASARRIAAHPGLEAHLKVNTGMNRWGVEPSEVGEARKILGPQLAGVYTHLASADSDEVATRRQIERFDSVLAAQPFGGVLVHAANSAATLWHPDSHYDCVRPGVALYGLHPAGDEGDPAEEDLRPVDGPQELRRGRLAARPRGRGVLRADVQGRGADVRGDGAGRVRGGVQAGALRAGGGPDPGHETPPAWEGLRWTPASSGSAAGSRWGTRSCSSAPRARSGSARKSSARAAGTINYEITTGVNPRRVERSYKDVRGS